MDLQQLAYFRAAARLENISRAAEQLGMTQPALSRSLARLERDVGAELFVPAGRNVRLSPAGTALLPYAERALDAMAQGRRALADLIDSDERTIALGFLHTLGAEVVPDMVRSFGENATNVRFDFVQSNTLEVRRRLIEGELDLALLSGPWDDERITWRALFQDGVVLLVPEGHRLAKRRSVALAEVANESFVSFKPGIAMRELSDELAREAGFQPQIVFEGEESGTVAGFVGARLGIAIVPAATAPAKGTVRIRIANPPAFRTIGLAWSNGRYLSRAARTFRDFVIAR